MRPSAQAHHDVFEEIEDRKLDRLVHKPIRVEQDRVVARVRPKIGLLRSL